MVFEVMGTVEAPRLVAAPAVPAVPESTAPAPATASSSENLAPAPGIDPGSADDQRVVSRSLPEGVIAQLLRSAVSLQAEGMLRTAGALAGVWGAVLDRREWVERDARALSALAAAAAEAKVPLPAGLDAGAGDPEHSSSVLDGMLASHEASATVLRQLLRAIGEGDTRPWLPLVEDLLRRCEEEMLLLRAVGAVGELPSEERYVRGRPPQR